MALYGLTNAKLGVSGGWLQLLFVAERRPVTEPWRLWFTGGLVTRMRTGRPPARAVISTWLDSAPSRT